ncbi:helix-turn-helix domain-containing protein [Dechloromonas sp. A34]|uniref:helix-turn-helix domain-containing protein n=1 Tax=Dechloromonas sp. A34 TaxID=447588 RepID=UPI002248C5D3|nr:hypothetical protein [Dechloromonas sp. A34]
MNTSVRRPFEDGRLTGVFLENGYEVDTDPDYGECVGYHDINQLTRQIGVALSMRPGCLRGHEFQYIRKAMGIPRAEIGRLFGRTELTIANWESKNKVPLEASVLLKQKCLTDFGYPASAPGALTQLGIAEFSDEPIVMTFDATNKAWTSNLHPNDGDNATQVDVWIEQQASLATRYFVQCTPAHKSVSQIKDYLTAVNVLRWPGEGQVTIACNESELIDASKALTNEWWSVNKFPEIGTLRLDYLKSFSGHKTHSAKTTIHGKHYAKN